MKRLFVRTVIAMLFFVAMIVFGDLASFYLRKALNRGVYDSVAVDVVNVIPQKGNKAEYVPQGVQNVACVRSLLPHAGQSPCWYVRRNAVQEVKF